MIDLPRVVPHVLPPLLRASLLVLASGCMSAASPQARDRRAETADQQNWRLVTAALPRQRISRAAVGLPVGARGWATLNGTRATLFYRLTPAPEDPDLLVVDSPLRDERLMTENGRFLGVLQQDCVRARDPDHCATHTTLAVSVDAPAGAEAGRFEAVDLAIEVVADPRCNAPETPRAFTVEPSRCPGGQPGGPGTCPIAPARDGGYKIGPFRVLIATWVALCGVTE